MASAAVPRLLRIPAITRRTGDSSVGDAKPAVWCAWLIAEIRRVSVETLWIRDRDVR